MKTKWFPGIIVLVVVFEFCKEKVNTTSTAINTELNLKTGEIISCGSQDMQLGTAEFNTACSKNSSADFNLGVKLLHSFEYNEAEKSFAKVVEKDPDCAMAYWGIAMSNFHPLWEPPTEDELEKGIKAVQIAKSLRTSKRESGYIDAIAAYFQDWQTADHRARCVNFEKAMAKIFEDYPQDKEAAVFYALALVAAADPNDKTFTRQIKAGEILQGLYPGQPNHPGIVHYLIHTYDYPQLAQKGLEAARKYASIAPSSAHALHMPSHIFTRLGLWDECITSNTASASSAKCYSEAIGIKGHWDEELHALDYLEYAYLQKGANDSAKSQVDYLKSIKEVHPINFKVAYAYAAIPSRYLLENRMWADAAKLEVSHPANLSWNKFPWQKAIIHFTRLLGSVHTNDLNSARKELLELNRIHDTLVSQKDSYKANQVGIQIKASEAWIHLKEGKTNEALTLMQLASEMEDKTEKHPVTPGEVIPARELLGDLLLEMNQPGKALEAYEENLKKHANRFNGLYGAGLAAEQSGNIEKARLYYEQLTVVVAPGSDRKEVNKSKQFLQTLTSK